MPTRETTMAPRPVRRRAAEAQALQWTGENTAQMEAFLGPDFEHDPDAEGDEGTALRTSKHSTWEPLYLNDWALRTSGGDVLRAGGSDYATEWEPADGPVRQLVLEVRDEDEAVLVAVLLEGLRVVDDTLAELKGRGRRIPPEIADEVRGAAILSALRVERGHGTAVGS